LSNLFSELGLDEDELEYALRKAKGVIIGYAMEYRAVKILRQMGFKDIKLVTSPTHDIEAVKDGKKCYIEVKASKYSPTKHYTAWKIAMIALLDGEHYTLIMKNGEYALVRTRSILSKPKQQLFDCLLEIKNNGYKQKTVQEQYKEVVEWFKQQLTIRKLQASKLQKYP